MPGATPQHHRPSPLHTLCHRGGSCPITSLGRTQQSGDEPAVPPCPVCACVASLHMSKKEVHAWHSCACACQMCIYDKLMHAWHSCACARQMCIYGKLMHAWHSCACERQMCMHDIIVHSRVRCACMVYLCMRVPDVHLRHMLAHHVTTHLPLSQAWPWFLSWSRAAPRNVGEPP